MIKVYMKIPGVEKPYSTIGDYLFEDEKYLVITQDVSKKRIPWSSVLYTEEITTGLRAPEPPPEAASRPQSEFVDAPTQESKLTDIMVAFTGATSNIFRLSDIPTDLLEKNTWTPELAKIVFSNRQVRQILGDFVIKDCAIDGTNITITTGHSKKSDASLLGTIPPETAKTLEAFKKFTSSTTATQTGRPSRMSMKLPTDFSMTASPFEQPVHIAVEENNERSDRAEEEPSQV